ncbi:MAG TPA: DUF1538 domain-containing protein [Synergistaceae bacterium]|nr:DUF1538 domain-containing protein [Synergistaceae bacterium]
MNLLEKLKETGISVVPIIVIVLLLYPTVAPIGGMLLMQFIVGGVLIILGLSVFLLGTDIGVLPMGHAIGAALVHRRNLPIMLATGFFIGFFITVAEPDVQVLANQVATVDPSISRLFLLVMIGLGVGFFVSVAFWRIMRQFPYHIMLLGFYLLVFALAYFSAPQYLGIAFDAGGATTGPMTVPFIMALGVGVAAVRGAKSAEDDSFGLVGLASIGPIMAVLIMGVLSRGDQTGQSGAQAATAATGVLSAFLAVLPGTTHEVTMALAPLAVILVIFQVTMLHMGRHQVTRMAKGLLYTFLGLVIFLTGVNGGFLPAGFVIGGTIGGAAENWVLVPIGFALGAMVVLAEPAVWVLNNQVEEVSGGHINRRFMLIALSAGVSVSVAISMIRVLTGMSIWWYLIPGYLIALVLTFACPPLFTAIAFDSGGVASGPMSSTFILSFTIGASSAAGGNPITDAFGVVAMIAMTPLITIQALGLLFQRKEKEAERRRSRESLREGVL